MNPFVFNFLKSPLARPHFGLVVTAAAIASAWALPGHTKQSPVSPTEPDEAATPDPTASPYQSRIAGLLNKIRTETPQRVRRTITSGEVIDIDFDDTQNRPLVSIQNGDLNVLVENCTGTSVFEGWQALVYPLVIDVSAEADTKDPFVNLKWVLIANAIQSESDDGTLTCSSRATLPTGDLHKIILSYISEGRTKWSVQENFSGMMEYEAANRPERSSTLFSEKAILCRDATQLCYTNETTPELIGHLTFRGLRPIAPESEVIGEVFLQTRRTKEEISERYPRLNLDLVHPPQPIISKYLANYNEYINLAL